MRGRLPQGVVTIQVKSLSLPHHSCRPLPAQLDVMEVERSFSSGVCVCVCVCAGRGEKQHLIEVSGGEAAQRRRGRLVGMVAQRQNVA